ncbi:MAG: TetR/AcrR family transcriptional regulator [Capsulimonadaceae bacterium]|nr:TetR/AcrR family transcriptional regulator [Capsulimonadaceae bacterium]
MKCPKAEALDPRVRRTRQLLFDAFRSLILEKRFSTISVQDIAERATVNRATFYAHYVDKDDLAASLLRSDLQAAIHVKFPELPVFNYENVVGIAVVTFEFLASIYDRCPRTGAELQDTVGATVQGELYELTDAWLTGNPAVLSLFPGRKKEAIATVLSWSIYGGAYRWSRSKVRQAALGECREIIGIVLPQSTGRAAAAPE